MTEHASRRAPCASAFVSAVASAVLVLAPGAWGGLLSGTRFTVLQAAAFVAIGLAILALLVFRPRQHLPWRTTALLAAFVAVKVGLGLVDVPTGWRGTYTMLTPEPPLVGQFAWRLAAHSYRIDPDLELRDANFRLSFLNDFHRYNAPAYAPPRSVSEHLRVTWTGWVDAPGGGEVEIHAQARGSLRIWIGGEAVEAAAPSSPLGGITLSVPAGVHRVDVTYDKPTGFSPAVFARVLLDGRPVVVQPWPGRSAIDTRVLAWTSDALVLLGLLVWLWQMARRLAGARARGDAAAGGAVVALAAALFLGVFAVRTAAPFAATTYELRPGDDHLAYEGLARHILADGILMPEGQAPGQGRPFFFYPLYSYVLAGMHLAFGDTHAAIVLLNAGAAVVLPVCFWLLGWRWIGLGAQLIGQGLLLAFVVRHNARYFESPITDSLFIPLVFVTLVLAARTVAAHRPSQAFLTGTAIAAGATTRPSFFLFVAPYLAVLAWSSWRRPPATRVALLALVLLGYALALSPVVLRNWIMAGQAVAMVTLSHSIPISLIPPEAHGQFTFPPGVDVGDWSTSLSLAWHIIRADPFGVMWLETRKVLFTLGLTNLGPGAPPLVVEFPLLFLAAAVAFVLRRVPWRSALVLAAFLLSHLAAIVIAYPWTYGYKTILPVHLVFLFCAAYLVPGRRATGGHAV